MIRSRLTFANVVAMLALCLSLGGVSYAAVTLPEGSVGTRELANKAVTKAKLAPGSVQKRALAKSLQREIFAAPGEGGPGPAGPAGVAGLPGAPGAAGPEAARIHFVAAASEAPAPQIALDYEGLRLRATCVEDAGEIELRFFFYSAEGGMMRLSIIAPPADDGESAGVNAFEVGLPVAEETPLEGPNADGEEATWSLVDGLLVAGSTTFDLQMSVEADAKQDECAIEGVAVAAS